MEHVLEYEILQGTKCIRRQGAQIVYATVCRRLSIVTINILYIMDRRNSILFVLPSLHWPYWSVKLLQSRETRERVGERYLLDYLEPDPILAID